MSNKYKQLIQFSNSQLYAAEVQRMLKVSLPTNTLKTENIGTLSLIQLSLANKWLQCIFILTA